MNTLLTPRLSSRLLPGFGTLTLLAGIGLLASRPAHTAGGPIGVTVTNTPLATTAADNKDKQAFQSYVYVGLSNGSYDSTADTKAVPVGKRLVIESVTARARGQIDSNTSRYSVFYQSGGGGLGSEYAEGCFNIVPDGSPFSIGASHSPLYAEAGEKVSFTVYRDRKDLNDFVLIWLTGHLVDIATPGGSS